MFMQYNADVSADTFPGTVIQALSSTHVFIEKYVHKMISSM